MIPPAWLAVYRASNEPGLTTTAEEALALVERLDSLGYTIAITEAFDKSKIPQGVKLPDDYGVVRTDPDD